MIEALREGKRERERERERGRKNEYMSKRGGGREKERE